MAIPEPTLDVAWNAPSALHSGRGGRKGLSEKANSPVHDRFVTVCRRRLPRRSPAPRFGVSPAEMSATHILINLIGEIALLLWGIHMVQSGVTRVFGTDLRRTARARPAAPASALSWPGSA